jgi:hypothetical protein
MNGVYLDNQAGVQFTLYELKQELKSRGHDINLPNLVDALRICSGVLLSIWRDNDKNPCRIGHFSDAPLGQQAGLAGKPENYQVLCPISLVSDTLHELPNLSTV